MNSLLQRANRAFWGATFGILALTAVAFIGTAAYKTATEGQEAGQEFVVKSALYAWDSIVSTAKSGYERCKPKKEKKKPRKKKKRGDNDFVCACPTGMDYYKFPGEKDGACYSKWGRPKQGQGVTPPACMREKKPKYTVVGPGYG